MKDWQAVRTFALSLPGTRDGSFYGQPCVTARNKTFVSESREAGSFHVRASPEEKALLMETDPATFWQTPHFANWPGLLVRYGAGDADRVAAAVTRAWWDMAGPKLRDSRPRP